MPQQIAAQTLDHCLSRRGTGYADAGTMMKSNSPVIKRSIVIGGHKTSISVEDDFWVGLKHIAGEREAPVAKLVQEIDGARERGNLSSAIRVYVLRYYRQRGGFD